MSEHLLLLCGGRQYVVASRIVDPVAATECLKDWNDVSRRNPSGLGRSYGSVDHVVVDR
jgi:hypothetical protein